MPLRITLQDYPGAQPDMLTTAIARFRRELERKLGDDAEAAFKAFQNASESSANELTKDEHRLPPPITRPTNPRGRPASATWVTCKRRTSKSA